MPSKGTTTVVLTPLAKRLLLKHRNAFGMKKVLSAGLMLFDQLDPAGQIALVSEVEGPQQTPTVLAEVLDDLDPGQLSAAERKAVRTLQTMVEAKKMLAAAEADAAATGQIRGHSRRTVPKPPRGKAG